MESGIKKRAVLYGLAAILLAVVLGAFIYDFSVRFPLKESELPLAEPPIAASLSSFLTKFSSSEELKNYLTTNSRIQGRVQHFSYWDTVNLNPLFGAKAMSITESTPTFEHSSTNVQVAGVDEIDIVETDDYGYIYALSDDVVSILKAYPADETAIVSRITLEGFHPVGIFIDGDRLAVLGSKYDFQNEYPSYYYSYYNTDIKTFVKIYDIHDRTNPKLLRDQLQTGSYFDSRKIGDYIYFVVKEQAYVENDTLYLPEIYSNCQVKQMAPTEIYYVNGTDNYYLYTTFVAMNMQNTTEAPVYLPIMLGESAGNMYVSLSNIYVTFHEWSGNTTIYRVRIQTNNMTCETKGKVTGQELNQFSMDEHDGYFRIVTTAWTNWTQQNNLYVLDMNLSITGKLENLATGENFHSARFMDNRAYLVTFKQVDPLFVINLTDPTNPCVLGELKIPGYSDYLHPYDETHIIGVGKETEEDESGFFAWYQGVKISLFDVSDVTNPTQMASYIIGDRGSDSSVLKDHRAFLFDRTKNLLVIPVKVAKVDPSQYPYGVSPNAYGQTVWQGAYVFKLTLEHGFEPKGNITHLESGVSVENESYWVKRILYIENVLYTVSDKKVKLNDLEDLTFIEGIELS